MWKDGEQHQGLMVGSQDEGLIWAWEDKMGEGLW